MQTCGLSAVDFQIYMAACALPHQIFVSVDLQTNDGTTVVSFDAGGGGGRDVTVTDGSVTVDADQAIGRLLDLTVADPSRQLIVSQDANYTDRMLHVSVGVPVGALDKVVWADVFTGPIVSAPRSGDVVQFQAHGKARFGMHGLRDAIIFAPGIKKTDLVKKILNTLAGEPYSRMGAVPDLPNILANPLRLGILSRPWGAAQNLTIPLARHLCYDGAGNLLMPRVDTVDPVYTFTDALLQPGVVSGEPTASTDWSLVKNSVKVIGGATATTPAPIATAFADPANPFSAEKLGRNGSLTNMWDEVTITTVHTQATAQRIANMRLSRDLVANRQIKFEAMPMYVFDEYDLVQVSTPTLSTQTHLKQFAIPLTVDGSPTMSFGFDQRVSSDRFARMRK